MTDEPRDPAEEARFAAVVEQYGQLLHRAVLRFCPRHLGVQADDVEQEARLRLWNALRRERPIHDLASYIYRVAATATIDAIRRVKARREQPMEPETDGPGGGDPPAAVDDERTLERRRLLEKVEAVLAELEPRRAQVVRLHAQGFTTVEMGRLMGTTEAAARNLLHRALKELRQRLQERGIAYAGD